MSGIVRESLAAYGVRPRLWTVDEYYRAAEKGVFSPDERLELLRGEVVELSPQRSAHSSCITRVSEALRLVFPGSVLRIQMPLRLDEHNEPEPDVVIAKGPIELYDAAHAAPEDVLLIVEVSDTTLRKDRKLKSALYAEFGIPEYWIIDLKSGTLEVNRRPSRSGSDIPSFSFSEVVLMEGTVVASNSNGTPVAVGSLLPRR